MFAHPTETASPKWLEVTSSSGSETWIVGIWCGGVCVPIQKHFHEEGLEAEFKHFIEGEAYIPVQADLLVFLATQKGFQWTEKHWETEYRAYIFEWKFWMEVPGTQTFQEMNRGAPEYEADSAKAYFALVALYVGERELIT